MNLRMTLGAFCGKGRLPALSIGGNGSVVYIGVSAFISNFSPVEMHLMTLQTEEGFILHQQVVGHRTVGFVANITIFNYRFMLKNKGALLG